MPDTTRSDAAAKELVEEEYDTNIIMSLHASSALATQSADHSTNPGSLPVQGGEVSIKYDLKDVKDTYLDEYTREPLPHHLVRAAIRDELD